MHLDFLSNSRLPLVARGQDCLSKKNGSVDLRGLPEPGDPDRPGSSPILSMHRDREALG